MALLVVSHPSGNINARFRKKELERHSGRQKRNWNGVTVRSASTRALHEMQYWKMVQITRPENAGPENAGLEND